MNIKQAKEEIRNTIEAYLLKDEFSQYCIETVHQRPILLMGPPGIGKTAVMEQIASELSIAIVSYTMTHHTRQSAVGLPYIEKTSFDGEPYSITRYTMSEIIASVYDKIEKSGKKEGILFLDEINCVSETLAPAMLQFLQGKTFGNHRLPEGWVIVAAGNPPEYNRSVREFDVVTLDRVRQINVEEDLDVFLEYAGGHGVHGAILSYLGIKKDAFYMIETEVDGVSYVTARGWEDLSDILKAYERMGIPVTKDVVSGYIHHEKTAVDFANYLELYHKYEEEYKIERIWKRDFSKESREKLRSAVFDEKLSVLTMILSAMQSEFKKAYILDSYVHLLYQDLLSYRERNKIEGAKDEAILSMLIKKRTDELRKKKEAVRLSKTEEGILVREIQELNKYLLQLRKDRDVLIAADEDISHGDFFSSLKTSFSKETEKREVLLDQVLEKLNAVFEFLVDVFGEGEELVIFVTELNAGKYAVHFLKERECEYYYKYNKELLFSRKRNELLEEIEQL